MKLAQHLALAVALCAPLAVQAAPGGSGGTTSENPDKTGIQAGVAAGFTGFNNVASGAILYTVPAGKRLVIESATILCGVPTVEKAYRAQISITNNGGQLSHHLAPVFTGIDANPIFATYIVNWAGKLYADAGPVQMGVFKNGTTGGSNTCHYTISGYLVTVP